MTDSIFHHPEHLHIELTNLCNASCPSCPRFYQNSSLVNPGLKLNSWSLQDFKNRLPIEFLKNITHIWISHEHPDHFSIPFFKQYFKSSSLFLAKTI